MLHKGEINVKQRAAWGDRLNTSDPLAGSCLSFGVPSRLASLHLHALSCSSVSLSLSIQEASYNVFTSGLALCALRLARPPGVVLQGSGWECWHSLHKAVFLSSPFTLLPGSHSCSEVYHMQPKSLYPCRFWLHSGFYLLEHCVVFIQVFFPAGLGLSARQALVYYPRHFELADRAYRSQALQTPCC